MMVLFTAIRRGWNDYNATKNQRMRRAITVCRQISYDRGFANNLASSQLFAWNKKIYEVIQSGSPIDQESNSLSSNHVGTLKCTDIIEQQYPTYIRDIFRYTLRLNISQSSFLNLLIQLIRRVLLLEKVVLR